MLNKRDFLKITSGAAVGAAGMALYTGRNGETTEPKPNGNTLSPITGDMKPISVEERKARIAKLQGELQKANIGGIVIEPGTSLVYFTGVRWGRSERLCGAVIPAEGDIAFVTPFFEEPRLRERMTFGDDVRPWHEHESPFDLVAGILKDRGVAKGNVAFEDTVRFFVQHEVMNSLGNDYQMVSGRNAVNACRMYKDAHELTLMHRANEITLLAYKDTISKLEAGMTQRDIAGMMRSAQNQLGGTGTWSMALIGESSAYPHGQANAKPLAEGDILLMDCGTNVFDYESDISRTLVFGEPTKRHREVWNTVRKGQAIAFDTAAIGLETGKVDDAVRAYYESLGYGPGYATPGLSHRTGHGIGMDGHEEVNFVHGEKTPLAKGMCLSNEPGIYIYGEFGVRIEDCIYMTDNGPQWFTMPPDTIDEPLGKLGPAIKS